MKGLFYLVIAVFFSVQAFADDNIDSKSEAVKSYIEEINPLMSFKMMALQTIANTMTGRMMLSDKEHPEVKDIIMKNVENEILENSSKLNKLYYDFYYNHLPEENMRSIAVDGKKSKYFKETGVLMNKLGQQFFSENKDFIKTIVKNSLEKSWSKYSEIKNAKKNEN